jgi:hypothetical protein
MAIKGDLSTLRGLKQRIAQMPVSVAHEVAQRAAPALTGLAVGAFDARQNVYGDARKAGPEGVPSLVKTGATKRTLAATSNGTIVRFVLGTPWAKYLIGKYGILPIRALPSAWRNRLDGIVAETRVPL